MNDYTKPPEIEEAPWQRDLRETRRFIRDLETTHERIRERVRSLHDHFDEGNINTGESNWEVWALDRFANTRDFLKFISSPYPFTLEKREKEHLKAKESEAENNKKEDARRAQETWDEIQHDAKLADAGWLLYQKDVEAQRKLDLDNEIAEKKRQQVIEKAQKKIEAEKQADEIKKSAKKEKAAETKREASSKQRKAKQKEHKAQKTEELENIIQIDLKSVPEQQLPSTMAGILIECRQILQKGEEFAKVTRIELGERYKLLRDQVQMKKAGKDPATRMPWSWTKWQEKFIQRSRADIHRCIQEHDDYIKENPHASQNEQQRAALSSISVH